MSGIMEDAGYVLRHNARCVTSIRAETNADLFLVATVGVKGVRDLPGKSQTGAPSHDVQLLEYNDDTAEVQCLRIYAHPGEVWSLSPCPRDKSLFASLHTSTKSSHALEASVFKMSDIEEEVVTTLTSPLEKFASLDDRPSSVTALQWGGTESLLLTCAGMELASWAALDSGLQVQSRAKINRNDLGVTSTGKVSTLSWDPFHSAGVACACGQSIVGLDLRSGKTTFSIKYAHDLNVRDIDYSPSRQHFLASAGDDGSIRSHDLRRANTKAGSLCIPSAHAHSIMTLRHCPASDRLIASGGSDGFTRLWDTSKAFVEEGAMQDFFASSDRSGLIQERGEQQGSRLDSIYSLAWAAKDKWTYAAVSFDGRLFMQTVPQEIKYSILL
uniref:EIPR1-like beta-propeller domain-containing protein n=1 Tax=Guillardia theta TaxID=55529 RepID=A0A7S4PHM5_GUITH